MFDWGYLQLQGLKKRYMRADMIVHVDDVVDYSVFDEFLLVVDIDHA